MRAVHRPIPAWLLAATCGLIAVGGVVWLAGRGDGVDGEFVLDQPGVFSEPVTTVQTVGAPLPDLALPDGAGTDVALSSFRGRPLVVNVWYSTCLPCAQELADFAEVSAEHDGHVQFVGINPRDDVETMLAFAAERGVTFPLLRDTEFDFVRALSVAAYPTTLFVDASGQILRQTNAIDGDDLRRTILELY